MRRFTLQRREDPSGVSGTGTVAEGVAFTDGSCTLRWLSETPSTNSFNSVDDMLSVHGHEGRTTLRWLDKAPRAGRSEQDHRVLPITVNFQDAPPNLGALVARRAEIISRLGRMR
jgi:hypothetical protein